MELKKITENVYYIPNPANIGVLKDGEESAILIDSGLDDESGKKILKLIEENNLSLKAIINTHSHADHCGGNKYLKEKTGAIIYAPDIESAIIQYPALEPLYLFSGASALNELKNKFLMAQPSNVDHTIKKDEKKLKFEKLEVDIIPLLGHSPNQIGIGVDGVLFCADSIFSEEVLKKHKIPFYTDIDKTKETLRFLSGTNYNFYVPSHAEPRSDISDLSAANIESVEDVEKYLLSSLNERKTTEQVLKELCNHYDINMKGTQQYYLMNTVTMAYLSSLNKQGKLKVSVMDNSLVWNV